MFEQWLWRVRALVVGAIGLAALAGTPATATGHRGRAVEVAPTAYVEFAPTAFVVPSAYYVVPSAYYVATSAVEYTTAPLLPSVYVETSYVPTSYVVPTVATYPVVTATSYVVPTSYRVTGLIETAYTAAVCCDPCAVVGSVPAAVMPGPAASPVYSAPAASAPSKTPPAPGKGVPSAVRPPASVESSAAGDEPSTSAVGERTAPAETTAKRPPVPPAPGNVDAGMPSPPAAPAAERDLSVTPASPVTPIGPAVPAPGAKPEPAAPAQPADDGADAIKKLEGPVEVPATPPAATPPAAKPPVAPGGEERAPVEVPPPADETVQRTVQRPVMTASAPAPYRRPARLLHWLEGKVVAGDSGRPEEGVKVTLVRKDRTDAELVVLSDADGRYGVRLPDGSWSVRVTMPSGRTYTVSELIVDKGQISDDLGRSIPSLTITR